MEESLWNAVRDGKMREIKEIFKRSPTLDVNWKNDNVHGYTALHVACNNSDGSLVALLLAHPDIDPNQKSSGGETPFLYACEYGNAACVLLLLEDSRVLVNEPEKNGFTPLYWAAHWGRLDTIRWWIASGREMDLGQPGKGKTEAIEAAKKEQKAEVASLLKRFKENEVHTRELVRKELHLTDFPVLTPPKLTKEQYVAFLDGKPLDQIVSSATQKEKDLLLSFRDIFTIDQLLKCPICRKTLTNPRTLPCLHSFCLDCLGHQRAAASSPFQLRCHQCQAPFTPSATGGVGSFGCIAFIASLKDALVGTIAVKRISRCQKHLGIEIDTYCKTCNESLCAKCLGERHSGHPICLLSQITSPLQDQIAGFTINMAKREKEAGEATTLIDGIVHEIEEQRSAAEKEIATFSSTLHAAVDARIATLICDMHEKGDQLTDTAARVKREVESATVEFREFRIFTEGLLSEGTPHEIVGSHKMVQDRNETLWSLEFSTKSLVLPSFKFSPGDVEEVKQAISKLGSIVAS